ncbi:alpha/beta hydrolase [Roseiarcaceae bacterium H3SJ34-1]|uniref:alpha/beta fold hydrolase n=1 Tax=Terripilifer ovatus TaxID=3032367 RepID=UPI003AB94A7C|nr:alpha/beta hydrolase [Roseiarcaceae bacterium H3SJ34-1]
MRKMLAFILLLVAAALAAALVFTQWEVRRIEARYPARGQFVDVDGGRIHLVDTRPDGEPIGTILLIHGASGNEADMRLPLAPGLQQLGFRVISVDRPGHGRSARLGGSTDASPARQAVLIRAAMEKIGVQDVIVVGHSLAGVMAINLALDHSRFARGLVLLAPVSHPWPGGIALYYSLTATPVIGPLVTNTVIMPLGLYSLDTAIGGVFAPQPAPDDYSERVGIPLVLRPASFRANSQDVDVIKEFVTREAPRYGNISVPTAVVTGDQDAIVYTHIHSYGSARDIPGATLQVLPGVGHSPHWAQPRTVIDAIMEVAARTRAHAAVK